MKGYIYPIRAAGWTQIFLVVLGLIVLVSVLASCAPTMPTDAPDPEPDWEGMREAWEWERLDALAEEEYREQMERDCAYVTALKAVNVREGPSLNSAVVDYLEGGTMVEILHKYDEGNWWFVKNMGFVDSAYLESEPCF